VKERLMKLYRDADIPADPQALWCHESRLASVVRLIVCCGLLAIPVIHGWKSDRPWVLGFGIAGAAVVIPLMLIDMAARFRATNWVLRIGSDGLWVNLRSYRDKVSEAASVVRFDYGEIASAGRHTEVYSTPSKMTGPGSQGNVGGSTIWHDEFLEIQLIHEQTDELKAALNNLRYQAPADQSPSGQVPNQSGPFPVCLVSPSVLRIAWNSGHGHAVTPRTARALAELETHVRVAEPTRRQRPDWRKLTAEQAEELARELVQVHGACFEPVSLLVRAGGTTDAEARDRVKRFEDEGRQQSLPARHP
jgi:hypothetical protein